MRGYIDADKRVTLQTQPSLPGLALPTGRMSGLRDKATLKSPVANVPKPPQQPSAFAEKCAKRPNCTTTHSKPTPLGWLFHFRKAPNGAGLRAILRVLRPWRARPFWPRSTPFCSLFL
jgi:hypothetical protein